MGKQSGLLYFQKHGHTTRHLTESTGSNDPWMAREEVQGDKGTG